MFSFNKSWKRIVINNILSFCTTAVCFALISTYQGIIASSTGLQLHEKAPLDLIAGVSAGIGVQWMKLTFCCTQCMVQFYPDIDLAEYKSLNAIKANYKSNFMCMIEILYRSTSVLICGMGCMYWFILIFNAQHHAFWNTQTLCLTENLMYCRFLYQTGESLSLRNVPGQNFPDMICLPHWSLNKMTTIYADNIFKCIFPERKSYCFDSLFAKFDS